MSHYTVCVIGENVDDQLQPFDESIEVPRRKSKEEHIQEERELIEQYKNGRYAEYLADPEKYLAECTHEGHIKYITEEFPKKLKWTDEEIYKHAMRYCDPQDIADDGSTLETYNPNSKWDWYVIGGRWSGMIRIKSGSESGQHGERSFFNADEPRDPLKVDSAKIKDIDWQHEDMENFGTFAVLKDGKWYERGEMGWWGMVSNEKEDEVWDQEFKKLMKDLDPETRITIVDCHI